MKRNQVDQRIDDRPNIEIPEEIIENITSRDVKGKFDDFFRDTRGFGSFDSIRRRERKGRCVRDDVVIFRGQGWWSNYCIACAPSQRSGRPYLLEYFEDKSVNIFFFFFSFISFHFPDFAPPRIDTIKMIRMLGKNKRN